MQLKSKKEREREREREREITLLNLFSSLLLNIFLSFYASFLLFAVLLCVPSPHFQFLSPLNFIIFFPCFFLLPSFFSLYSNDLKNFNQPVLYSIPNGFVVFLICNYFFLVILSIFIGMLMDLSRIELLSLIRSYDERGGRGREIFENTACLFEMGDCRK